MKLYEEVHATEEGGELEGIKQIDQNVTVSPADWEEEL